MAKLAPISIHRGGSVIRTRITEITASFRDRLMDRATCFIVRPPKFSWRENIATQPEVSSHLLLGILFDSDSCLNGYVCADIPLINPHN
jgi:hypothetical protein